MKDKLNRKSPVCRHLDSDFYKFGQSAPSETVSIIHNQYVSVA